MATIDPTKTTIPAEMLQVQNRIETPSLNLSDPTPALQGVFSTLPQEQRQLEVDQAGQRTGASNFSSLVQSLTGMGADQAALEEKAGIGAIQKDVTDLTNQLNLIKAESQTIPLQTQQDYQGRLSTQAGVGAIETGKLRENAIKALTTSALLQAKQGSLLTAQNQVDRAIQLKSEPIKAQIEAIRQQLEINDKYFITPAEKKLAEKQKLALAERERQINKQEQGEQQLLTLITNASSQGAPQDLLRRAQAAKTPMEASMILGQYAGDYYKTELLRQQIQTEKAQRAKIYSSMQTEENAKSKAEADSWVLNIANGKAKLSDVPAKLKSLVSLGLAQTSVTDAATKAKIEASQSVYDLANELLTAEGKGGAVGFGLKKTVFAKIPGIDETAIAGTDRATYEAKFKQLKDTLASSNLDKLKGAMSDKDIEFLRNIGTALSLDMPESAFDAELKKVQNTMLNVPGVQVKELSQSNPFMQSLGTQPGNYAGTSIISNVTDNGDIQFVIPK